MSAPIIVCADCRKKKPHKARRKCGPCYGRWLAHGKPGVPPTEPRKPVQCGTRQGWDRHMYRKEKACDPCREAHADDVREWSHTSPRLMHRTDPPAEWDDTQTAAARKVADLAASPDDCRYLLDALGLLPEGVRRSGQIGGAA